MYKQSRISELIRFSGAEPGATVIDVYPGGGDWTRVFSDVVGPEGRVYSFVPAEVAHFKNDPVGLMRTLAKEPGRENVEVLSADLVAMPPALDRLMCFGCTCSTTTSTLRLCRPKARRQCSSIEPFTKV